MAEICSPRPEEFSRPEHYNNRKQPPYTKAQRFQGNRRAYVAHWAAFMLEHLPNLRRVLPTLAPDIKPGTYCHLAADCVLVYPTNEAEREIALDLGLVVVEGEPEPFGGPGCAEPIARAVESLKLSGSLPVTRPKAS